MTRLRCFVPDRADEPLGEGAQGDCSPGFLLADLERRQEHVIHELDLLNARIEDVLRGLGVAIEDVPIDAIPHRGE